MTRHESLFAEIIYDLSFLAGQDDLTRFIEDSRELFEMVKDWAETFDCRYPMPRNVMCDFSELHGDDYLTAIDYDSKENLWGWFNCYDDLSWVRHCEKEEIVSPNSMTFFFQNIFNK